MKIDVGYAIILAGCVFGLLFCVTVMGAATMICRTWIGVVGMQTKMQIETAAMTEQMALERMGAEKKLDLLVKGTQ